MSKHPKYKVMVLTSLSALNNGSRSKSSRYAISEEILSCYPAIDNNSHFKRNLKMALRKLEEDGEIKRIKQSYRKLPNKKSKSIIKSINKLTKNVKKISKTPIKLKTKKSVKKDKKTVKPRNKNNSKPKTNKKVMKTSNIPTAVSPIKIIQKISKTTKNAKVQRAVNNINLLNQPLPKSLKILSLIMPEKGVIWQYYDKSNHNAIVKNLDGWYDYDKKASDVVEEEWQKYIKNRAMCDVRAVKSGQFSYQVDFMSWNQTNLDHSAHTKRNIRRLDENGNVTINPYK